LPPPRRCAILAAPTVASDPPSADPLRAALQAAVGDQYAVVRLLGRGAMGAVYLARERALDRDVAIKVLPPERTGESERERFRREARTAARLTHPNIVPLHACGEADGTMYFVMGRVRGEALSVRMKRGFTAEAARRILMELADALDYAHRQGVIHRDIKPDNVLVDDDSGRPMLTDFGIAKAQGPATGLTNTGAVVGTPGYMSPEQAAGKEHIDGRSDLYSLGVMGYAMLAGRLPFAGPSASDVLVQHMAKEPPPLKAVAPDVPDALAAIVMRCLAKDPQDRWPDGRSLRDALAAAAADEELPEPLQAVDGVGLIILACGIVLGVLAYLQWLDRRPPEHASFGGILAFAAVAALAFLYKAMPARRAGFGWKSIAWAAFLEPRWWRWWYPRRLRRPEDAGVWDRLPARIRLDRVLYLAAPVMAVVGILISRAVMSPRLDGLADYPRLRAAFFWPPVVGGVRPFPAIGLFIGPLLWLLIGLVAFCRYLLAHRWLRRLGLAEHDRKGVISGPLSRRSLWRKPEVAALLRADSVSAGAATPRSPAELAAAISAIAETLAGVERDAAAEAAKAARHALLSIQEVDREIQSLAMDSDPQEKARVRARLDSLGAPQPGEAEERRKMRSLFAQQAQLLDELERRLAEAGERRTRRVELLKSLWLELANLRAEVARNGPNRGPTSGRVRALCARISAMDAPLPRHGDRDASEETPTVAR
jgi:hypothetical protein